MKIYKKLLFLFFISLFLSKASGQTSIGTGLFGFSPRGDFSFVQSVYSQVDVFQPSETILHFGIGCQYTYEYTQAHHTVPFAYVSAKFKEIYLGIRTGASYTVHLDERLKENVGNCKWFGYTGLYINWINEKPIGAFMSFDFSPKNNFGIVLGARLNLFEE